MVSRYHGIYGMVSRYLVYMVWYLVHLMRELTPIVLNMHFIATIPIELLSQHCFVQSCQARKIYNKREGGGAVSRQIFQ